MNSVQWLYRYVYRGIGFVLLVGMATVVAVTVMNLGCGRTDRAADARQKAATKKALKRMHENASEEMRKFNESQLQKREEPK